MILTLFIPLLIGFQEIYRANNQNNWLKDWKREREREPIESIQLYLLLFDTEEIDFNFCNDFNLLN